MTITLQNYHPFDYSKRLFHKQKDLWTESRGFLRTAAAIVKMIGTSFLYLVTFVMDLAYTAVSGCQRLIKSRQVTHTVHSSWSPSPSQPRRGSQASRVVPPPIPPAQAGRVATQDLIRTTLGDPYSMKRVPQDNTEFLKDALRAAFRNNNYALDSHETTDLYKQLIEDDGVCDGETPLDIFRWSAGCMICHNFVSRLTSNATNHLYPTDSNSELYVRFELLPRQEKAAALLQVMVPSETWELRAAAKHLVNDINNRAQAMSQDATFTKQIYNPVAREIDRL